MAGSGSAARSKARRNSAKKISQEKEIKNESKASEAPASKKASALHETTGLRGMYDKCVKFLASVKDETSRVTWPTGKELRSATIVVLVTLVLVSAYMGLISKVFSLMFHTPEATGL